MGAVLTNNSLQDSNSSEVCFGILGSQSFKKKTLPFISCLREGSA